MVTDTQTGDCHRADHLLEHALEALLEDTANPLTPERRKVRRPGDLQLPAFLYQAAVRASRQLLPACS